MAGKQHIILRFITLVLLSSIILTGCGGDNMFSKRPLFNISELIENENIDDISLTIYYVNPFILTLFPWSIDNLIDSSQENKIVVNGSDLKEHIDLFKQINNNNSIPVKKKSTYVDVRLYYVLESKVNGKLFDVAMWGGGDGSEDNSIIVNGIEVKGNDIFYDVIMPFLPENAAKEFGEYTDRE